MLNSHFLPHCSEGGFRNQPHRRSRNLQQTSPSKTTTTSNTSSPSKATSSPTPTSEYAPALPPKTYLDPDQDSGMGASTDQSYHELPNYNQYNVVSENFFFSCLFSPSLNHICQKKDEPKPLFDEFNQLPVYNQYNVVSVSSSVPLPPFSSPLPRSSYPIALANFFYC